uniref:uncharacterized protein LOC122609571 isoform X2 n=1 Tax=Erigeron canadensis TaxID=72917 RepID=UPI001CB8C705|nr:uncharacterized protein LOC122609571 isoform X2 [Erigeron canadensis]
MAILSKGISYSRLFLRNLHSKNVSTSSHIPKTFKDDTMRFLKTSSSRTTFQARRGFCDRSGNQESPDSQPPSSPPSHLSSHWGKWTTGIGLTMIIPFLQFKDVDLVIETAEEIIDVIEVVAEAVDTVAEKIANDLPEGNKIKTNMLLVEEVAEKIAGKAEKVIEIIDEVQAAEQKLNPVIKPVKELTQAAPSETS